MDPFLASVLISVEGNQASAADKAYSGRGIKEVELAGGEGRHLVSDQLPLTQPV